MPFVSTSKLLTKREAPSVFQVAIVLTNFHFLPKALHLWSDLSGGANADFTELQTQPQDQHHFHLKGKPVSLQGCEKAFAPLLVSYMFQIIKQILISDKSYLSKYKMQFLS